MTVFRAASQQHAISVFRVYQHALRGFAFQGREEAARAIERNPRVEFVAQDQEVELVAQTLPTGINRIDADVNPISHIDGIDDRVNVNVGILDTGVDPTHPDLNVLGGENCLGGTSFVDGHGHGSHVSGTVGALDNDIGVVGVAPGANLYAAKVLSDGGSGSFSSVACGLDFAVRTRSDHDPTNDIAVVNLSLTGVGSDDGNCGKSITRTDFRSGSTSDVFALQLLTLVTAGVNDPPPARVVSFAPPIPNPSRESFTLRFALARETSVRLGVYDASGRRVREHRVLRRAGARSGRTPAHGFEAGAAGGASARRVAAEVRGAGGGSAAGRWFRPCRATELKATASHGKALNPKGFVSYACKAAAIAAAVVSNWRVAVRR